ncbi:MBOAT family O-acyltransferase [Shewanella waksmanii]|uniref:MBOAT family O-acyltransferase n=1 Tax=Shewanella waksmanii TaxID=213783 RepID=UPI003736C15B
MTEQIIYLNAGIFISVWLSLMLKSSWQMNGFLFSTLLLLVFISQTTAAALLAFSSLTYACSYLFVRSHRKMAIFVGVSLCVLIFVAAKILHAQAAQVVFIGVIYVVCRQIHFLVDTMKSNTLPCGFLPYLRYQCFLPCLIAGPIHRVDDFERQLRRRKVSIQAVSNGLERVVWGHFKVIVIAAALINYIELQCMPFIQHAMLTTMVSSLFDWIKLYIVFSGFSDIAIGFSLMLGITIKENFNFPFISQNINEFWQRWHISLSQWCKSYVFTPALAISRSVFIASVLSMVVIGLWHEFSLRYVLWGIYHATGLIVYQWYSRQAWRPRLPKSVAVILTLLFVVSSYPITLYINQQLMFLLGS